MKKLQEDTTRQVTVAVFRVEDLSDPKHRFKGDYYLSSVLVVPLLSLPFPSLCIIEVLSHSDRIYSLIPLRTFHMTTLPSSPPSLTLTLILILILAIS